MAEGKEIRIKDMQKPDWVEDWIWGWIVSEHGEIVLARTIKFTGSRLGLFVLAPDHANMAKFRRLLRGSGPEEEEEQAEPWERDPEWWRT